MRKIERKLLCIALSSAMWMGAAHAQSADADPGAAGEAVELDRIRVTGIRRGIENAIETKQTSDSIVESISAEDIGKLPDISIAESIARLPGLAAQRVAGRSSSIAIRGLAENFSSTLLNGREQVSVGHSRGVEFDQYPSELINAVTVYKTPDASLVGQGLSGTVDLQTVRPLSFGERVMTVNLRGEENSLGELNPGYDDRGYRISGSYIDQFLDRRLGIAIGYARMDSPGQANRWESWGYPSDNAAVPGAYLLGGSKSQVSSIDNVRDGLMAVVEFDPGNGWKSVLDTYYSRFDKSETLRFMETGLGWSDATLTDAVIEDGRVVAGTFTGVRPVLRNDRNAQEDDIFAAGWNNSFSFGGPWSMVADLSYSRAERREEMLETYAGLGRFTGDRTDSVDFVFDPETRAYFRYGEDYTDPANVVLTDPAGWGQEGFLKRPSVEDRLWSAKLGAERMFETGIFSSVEFGVNHADRRKERRSGLEAILRLPDGEVAIPAGALTGAPELGFTGIPGSIGYDIDAVLPLYTVDIYSHADIRNKNWTVDEKVTTGYVQWNLNTDVGDNATLRGNIGVQLVHVDQSSTGYVVPFGEADTPELLTGGKSYNEVLPSMNLAFGLPHDQTLRVAIGRQMARPQMDELRANRNISIRTDRDPRGEWRGDGGNPELDPWLATALDLSYEKYFGGRGYVALAGFYKDLHSYVESYTIPYDFSGFDPRDFDPPSPIGEYTTPVNRKGGEIYGAEATVSLPLDLLWAPLDGFGIVTSFSATRSAVKPDGPGTPSRPLAGLSRNVSNITLYYEKHGFSARVSQRSRSPFFGKVIGYGGDGSFRWINEEDIVDAQIGYAFPEHSSLSGLSLLLQVNNVTNEPYREYFPDIGLPQMYNEYGRTVLLGLNYRF